MYEFSIDCVTVDEAARILGITPVTLRNWRKNGDGPPWFQLGPKTVRYRRHGLEEFLAGCENRTKLQSKPEIITDFKQQIINTMLEHESLRIKDIYLLAELRGYEHCMQIPEGEQADFIADLILIGTPIGEYKPEKGR